MRRFKVVYIDRSGNRHSELTRGESAEIVEREFQTPNGDCVRVEKVTLYTLRLVGGAEDISMLPVAL